MREHHHLHDHNALGDRRPGEHRGPHGRHRGMRGMEMGGGWGGGRRRMRRGDIRKAILLALQDGPAHGYEVMRRLEERSGGIWRPSPGSVYPTLQMLEDAGLVRSETADGTRTYTLTDQGTAEAATQASAARTEGSPWDLGDEADDRARELRQALSQVHLAAKQVASAGKPTQIERGIDVVQRARKELYQILAED